MPWGITIGGTGAKLEHWNVNREVSMGLQIPFIVALVIMGVLMLVVVMRTVGPAAWVHRWQNRARRQR